VLIEEAKKRDIESQKKKLEEAMQKRAVLMTLVITFLMRAL
jgi:hypothetical protein